MKILQRSKGPKHQDSFWYDGPIAKTERFTLVATGDIRVTFANEVEYRDQAARREARRRRLNDLGLQEEVTFRNNNWFEIIDQVEIGWMGETFSSYDDALTAFKQGIEAGRYRPVRAK